MFLQLGKHPLMTVCFLLHCKSLTFLGGFCQPRWHKVSSSAFRSLRGCVPDLHCSPRFAAIYVLQFEGCVEDLESFEFSSQVSNGNSFIYLLGFPPFMCPSSTSYHGILRGLNSLPGVGSRDSPLLFVEKST